MPMTRTLGLLIAVAMFAVSPLAGAGIAAPGEPDTPAQRNPNPIVPQKQQPPGQKQTTGTKKKKEQKSEQLFRDGYRLSFALVQAAQYEAAFASLKDLDADDNADVANLLGYTARKLGDYDLSKYWYERALTSDPKHVRTWQYYGMWQVEQGNVLKAHDFLQKIEAICGNRTCREYQDLKGGIEGTVTY
jgi:tetratricopeptide (TPR) repeat protein